MLVSTSNMQHVNVQPLWATSNTSTRQAFGEAVWYTCEAHRIQLHLSTPLASTFVYVSSGYGREAPDEFSRRRRVLSVRPCVCPSSTIGASIQK